MESKYYRNHNWFYRSSSVVRSIETRNECGAFTTGVKYTASE